MKPSFDLRLSIIGFALWLTACATNPVSGNPNFVVMSEAQEISLGRSADADVRKQYRVYDSPELQEYVNQEIGRAHV
jgi:predicted Zn-dependent protease